MIEEQNANRETICHQWKSQLRRNPQSLNNVVTCDESRSYIEVSKYALKATQDRRRPKLFKALAK